MQRISERSNWVNSECFPSYHPCSTWHFVHHPRTALKKISRSFSLHHHRLPTACDTSFLASAHLTSWSTNSYISYEMKRSLEEPNAHAQKKQINHWKLNQGIYSPILSFTRSFTAQELILDDGWLLFTLQNLTFILCGFVSCAHSHYSLDAHSFTPWQSELSVLLLWVICKNVHICERCFEVQQRPLGIARGTAIKKEPVGFLM